MSIRLVLAGIALLFACGCAAFVWQDPAELGGPVTSLAGLDSGLRTGDRARKAPRIDGPLTYEYCVALSLLNNKAIHIVEEEIRKARGDLVSTQAAGLPKIDIGASYVRLDEAVTADFGGQTIKLRPEDSYKAELAITQPIFTGGQIYYAVQAARCAERLALLGLATVEQKVAFGASVSFFEVLFARESLTVAKDNLALARAHLDNVSKRLAQGVASPFEELRAKAAATNSEAVVNQASNRILEKKLSLLRIMGLPLDTTYDVAGSLTFEEFEPDVAFALAEALKNRPDLASASEAVKLGRTTISIARAALLPKVFGFFNLGWEKPSGKSFVAGGGADYWNGGLSVSLPIFDGFATHGRLMKGYATLAQSVMQRADLIEEISLEIRKAAINVSDAAQFVAASKKNLELATEGQRLAAVGYDNGVNSQIDLLESQNGLALARFGYIQAVFGHALAKASFHNATGSLLKLMFEKLQEKPKQGGKQ